MLFSSGFHSVHRQNRPGWFFIESTTQSSASSWSSSPSQHLSWSPPAAPSASPAHSPSSQAHTAPSTAPSPGTSCSPWPSPGRTGSCPAPPPCPPGCPPASPPSGSGSLSGRPWPCRWRRSPAGAGWCTGSFFGDAWERRGGPRFYRGPWLAQTVLNCANHVESRDTARFILECSRTFYI